MILSILMYWRSTETNKEQNMKSLSVQNVRSAYWYHTTYKKHMPVGDGEGLEKWLGAPEEPDLLPLSSDLLLRSSTLSLDPERALITARGKPRSLEADRGRSTSPLDPLRPVRTGVIRLQTWGSKGTKHEHTKSGRRAVREIRHSTYPRRNTANSVVRLFTRIRRARSEALSSSN